VAAADAGAWLVSDIPVVITGNADVAAGLVGPLLAEKTDGSVYSGPVTLAAMGTTVDPPPPPPPPPVTVALDDQTVLDYSDGWLTATRSTAFGGTDRYTNSAGATATLRLTTAAGASVRFYGARDTHHGTASVTDGASPVVVDCYGPARQETAKLFEIPLGAGAHTIVVTCLGRNVAPSTGTVVALDKVEVTGLVSYVPPVVPPPPARADFQLGIVYTTDGPVRRYSPMPSAMGANLAKCCTAAAQHLGRSFGSALGDHRGTLDWSSPDLRVQNMATQGAGLRMIYLYAATVEQSGLADWNWDIAAPKDVTGFAQLCHDAVLRYLPRGVTHYPVWNEDKGISYDQYLVIYKAVYAAIKGDPRTAPAQVGGPYAIMMNHQDNRWGGSLKGAWGGVDPQVTAHYERFFAECQHDFAAVDISKGDIDGNRPGGSYNPKGLDAATMAGYAKDCAAWLRKRTSKPIIAVEAYWGGADLWLEFASAFQAGGGNVFMLWHESDGVAGRLVNGDGTLTDLGSRWAAWQLAQKKV
jgi:hypothetical protein